MKIDAARLQKSMEEMARVGATPGGGVHRLTLTDADREARDLFKGWAGEAGLAVSVDEMGNMFARREGSENSAPPSWPGATWIRSRTEAASTAPSACSPLSRRCGA